MAVTVLQTIEIGGRQSCTVTIDYDDVAQTIGATGVGTGSPTIVRLAVISPPKKLIATAMALAQFLGAGRQVIATGVKATDVLKFDADGVPTNLDVDFRWAS